MNTVAFINQSGSETQIQIVTRVPTIMIKAYEMYKSIWEGDSESDEGAINYDLCS